MVMSRTIWFGLALVPVLVVSPAAVVSAAAASPAPAKLLASPNPACTHVVPAGGVVDTTSGNIYSAGGSLIASYSNSCAPPAASAGSLPRSSAMATNVTGVQPFSQYVINYLDDRGAMFNQMATHFTVPPAPTNPTGAIGYSLMNEASDSTGAIASTIQLLLLWGSVSWIPESGPYYIVTSIYRNANGYASYTTPQQVQPGALVAGTIQCTGYDTPPNPNYPSPVVLRWSVVYAVSGTAGPKATFLTGVWSTEHFEFAFPELIELYNVTSCDQLPPFGKLQFGPSSLSIWDQNANPNTPQTTTPDQGPWIIYGTTLGTPGLPCTVWGTGTQMRYTSLYW
jgi:hypothetical protein